jgi:hypothetical protein
VQRVAGGLEFSHPLVRTQLLAGLTTAELQAVQYEVSVRLLEGTSDGDLVVLARSTCCRVSGPRPGAGRPVRPGRRAGPTVGNVASARRGCWRRRSMPRLGASAADLASRYLEAGRVAYLDHDRMPEDRLRRAAELAIEVGRPDVAVDAAMLLMRTRLGERPLDRSRAGHERARSGTGDGRARPGPGGRAGAMLAQARYSAGDLDGRSDLAEILPPRRWRSIPVPGRTR